MAKNGKNRLAILTIFRFRRTTSLCAQIQTKKKFKNVALQRF
jgi:hypothetical protein